MYLPLAAKIVQTKLCEGRSAHGNYAGPYSIKEGPI